MTDTNDDDAANSTDVVKLKKALQAERAGHKATVDALKAAKKELAAANERAIVGDNPTGAQIIEHISASTKAGVARETAEMQQRIATLEAELGEAKKNGEALLGQLTSRTISDEVREAARAAHVRPEAINDVLTFAAADLKVVDGKVQTADGASVEEWLDARKASSPYLWPAARGAGAHGSFGDGGKVYAGDNPFAPATFNLTAQGQLLQTNPEQAKRLQQLAAGA